MSLHLNWIKLTEWISKIYTRAILSVVFYLIVAPWAVLMRFLRGDFLGQKVEKKAPTYWFLQKQQTLSREDYEKQY